MTSNGPCTPSLSNPTPLTGPGVAGPGIARPSPSPTVVKPFPLPAPTNTVASTSAVGPGYIDLTERFLSDPSWPTSLVLDLGKSNWPEWSRRLELLADGQGFFRYLDGTLRCPDSLMYPTAYWIWDNNDRSLRAFILGHISPGDYDLVSPIRGAGARAIFAALRKRHEQLGLHAQVLTLRKVLDMRFDAAKSLDDTVTELRGLYNRIISMGPMSGDNVFTVLLINALGDKFPQLQSSIQSMYRTPGFSSAVVVQHIHEENMLLRSRTQPGQTALVATNRDRSPGPPCPNCQRMGHSMELCVQPGGKMAGKTFKEARTAQAARRAARRAAREANIAMTSNPVKSNITTPSTTPVVSPAVPTSPARPSIMVNGITYYARTAQGVTATNATG
jgi:hypothetical protein